MASLSFSKMGRRSGRFRYPRHAVLISMLCLLLYQHCFNSTALLSGPVVEAFVTPREQSRSSGSNNNNGRNNHRIHSRFGNLVRSKEASSSKGSTTTLYFFSSILTNQQPNGDGDQNQQYRADLPLARYVDVSANYTLAHTPEDNIELRENQRLVCVGDVHGDLEALKNFLETGGVYDRATDSWCGGDTIVVQCGDILDRGFEELACYQLLSKLSRQAPTQGGKVVLLIGNHEALNAMGLFQYAFTDLEHEQYIGKAVDETLGPENRWRNQYVSNQPARWASYEPGGLLAHSLMRNMKVAIKVGGTVCVHAGLRPEHLQEYGGIAGMNAAYREWISLGDDLARAADEANNYQNNPIKYNHHGNYPADNPRQAWVEAEERQQFYVNSIPVFLQNGPTGPIWMRDYSSPADAPPSPQSEPLLDATLQRLQARRLVMGHTIQRRINGVLGGRAWRVDVGASRGCLSGTPEVLEVACFRTPDGQLAETVSVLTPATAAQQQQQQQEMHPGQQPPRSYRIPARDRLVDVYTQAAVLMF